MKTLQQILLEANPKQKAELKKLIDKTSPSNIIEKHMAMLKKKTPDGLISMVKINHILKSLILSEVILVEDILSTSIYNSKFGKMKCKDIIEQERDFFPRDNSNNKIDEFKKILKINSNKRKDLLENNLFDVFNSFTLGWKIEIIRSMDSFVASSLVKSTKTKYGKKDLLTYLEYSRKIRNHVAHNFFVLNKGPYLKMIDKRKIMRNNWSEEDTIKFLFSNLENILKISGRGEIIKKIRKQISNNKNVNINNLDCTILNSH